MNESVSNVIKCAKCPATFESRGQRDSHNDRFHRTEVSVTYKDGTTSTVGRNSDGWFMCRCGAKYGRSRELSRHCKGCRHSTATSGMDSIMCIGLIQTVTALSTHPYSLSAATTSTSVPTVATATATVTMQNGQEHGFDQMVQYISEFEIAVCVACRSALNAPPGISRHLVSTHSWTRKEAKALEQQFIDQPIRSPNNIDEPWIIPDPEHPPIPYLNLYKGGFGCHLCNFVCQTKRSIRSHYSKCHRGEVENPGQVWRTNLWMQRFNAGCRKQYFEVARGHVTANPAIASSHNAAITDSRTCDIRQQLQAQVQQRTAAVARSLEVIQPPEINTEVNPWLERTGWAIHLQGQNRFEISKMTELPTKDETIIQAICDSLKRLITSARQSIEQNKVNHFDMIQINSFHRHKLFSKPLKVHLAEQTFKQYTVVWQRLLCYVFRTNDGDAVGTLLYKLTVGQKK